MSSNDFYYTCNGRLIDDSHAIHSSCTLKRFLRVYGGKGGFGSMLRALGARIEKTTNHEACRDLSGRRMRDVNNEKNIAEWMNKQETQEAEQKENRKRKLEKIVNPHHIYEDVNYTSSLQLNANKIDEALKHALEQRGSKPVSTVNNVKEKKPKLWLDIEDEEVSSNDEREEGKNKHEEENIPLEVNISQEKHKESLDIAKVNDTREVDPTIVKSAKDKDIQSIKDVEQNDQPLATLNEKTLVIADSEVRTSELTKNNVVIEQGSMLDLSMYKSAEHIEELGLDRLKAELVFHGLKCGGTLQERAKRLFLLKNTPKEDLPESFFAKKSKKKK